jgi:hypothetical protein
MSRKREFKSRAVADLVEEGEGLGWRFVRFTAHEGVLLRHPSGEQVTISQTPRVPFRAYRNVRAELRRVARMEA